jgi:uncharacterized membrane protein
MSAAAGTTPPAKPKRRRRLLVIIVVVVVAVAGLVAAIFVPVNSESKEIQFTTANSASATLSLPQSAWVTVHFDHHGSTPMSYWMDGAGGGGMMFNHQGMMGGDSYSFWSNGGDYMCWASYGGGAPGMSPVWVNATWGLL